MVRPWVDRSLDRLGGLLLPPRCVLCGSRGQPPCLDLCAACERDLPAADPAVGAGPDPLRHSFAPFSYRHPADHLVRSLKYHGHLAVGRVLGSLLARRVDGIGLADGIDVLVPVPLHPARLAGRGFNQSAEIAHWVGRGLRCRVDAALATRRRDTPPQVGLPRTQRRSNLDGAFLAAAAVRGRRVAIVDDVMTTGSTASALGQALLHAGARSVSAWCVCRAPAPERLDWAPDLEVRQA